LAQGAAKLGFADTTEFLEQIEIIRWSTTITSNVLAESRGPRIGLLVSQGHEKDLYGRPARSVVFDRVLAERDVIGLDGSADETEIMNAARTLLESGVRRICVSLKDAHHHPEREASIKRTIGEQYPDHFLGSVPVLAGSDISQSADDQTRTHCALINAYTHGALAATLFKAEDELRETSRYTGAFLVSHINGGVAGISKTRAIDTIESGPVLGIQGSAFMAKAYGLKDLIAMDIGGTTAKVSVLRGGEPVYRKPSDFFGIPVEISLPDLHAVALGGGSVVKIVGDAQKPAIQLGPESMGAYPGPACYGLGGDQPTLTDAFVAAGLINPDYFLGGTKPIDRELAWQIIQEMIAKPLHISTEEACQAIINRAFELVADLLITKCGMRNADLVTPSLSNPQSAIRNPQSECTLFAYGGNGGLFACGVAEKAGLDRVQVFSLGPVFSAFGSSVSDISHVYERSLPGVAISDDAITQVRQIVEEMEAEAVKDMLGEGVRPHDVTYTTEIEVSMNDENSVPVPCSESAFRSANELQAVLSSALVNCGVKDKQSAIRNPQSAILELIRVRAKKAMPKPKLAQRPLQGADGSHARTGTRQVFWGSQSGQAQIYRWESLQPGNQVEGCAVLEGANTTYFIPDGWVMVVDSFGNGALSRHSKQGQ
jgi:N-methylhydantoinase A/oxoprolinase/acetone carboxylase beta subunit